MNKTTNFYTRYNPPEYLPVDVGKFSRTSQEFKEETDINNMINKFYAQGFVPPPSSQPIYGDFTTDFDYMDAFNALEAANEYFESLPSKIRDDFNNDPAQFFDVYTRNPTILEKYTDIPVVNDVQQTGSTNETNIDSPSS